jgi:hypothetical protein
MPPTDIILRKTGLTASQLGAADPPALQTMFSKIGRGSAAHLLCVPCYRKHSNGSRQRKLALCDAKDGAPKIADVYNNLFVFERTPNVSAPGIADASAISA